MEKYGLICFFFLAVEPNFQRRGWKSRSFSRVSSTSLYVRCSRIRASEGQFEGTLMTHSLKEPRRGSMLAGTGKFPPLSCPSGSAIKRCAGEETRSPPSSPPSKSGSLLFYLYFSVRTHNTGSEHDIVSDRVLQLH